VFAEDERDLVGEFLLGGGDDAPDADAVVLAVAPSASSWLGSAGIGY
jgi:hypothetical protein